MSQLGPNLTASPYRGLSVQDVDIELTEPALREWLVGRRVYRRTMFVLVTRGIDAALVAITERSRVDLFDVVTAVEVLALPHEVIRVDDPSIDVGITSEVACVARRERRAGVNTYVVTGRYRHINFIHRPAPIRVLVDEVVPPHPPKLAEMARQALAFAEELPPVKVVQRLSSIPTLERTAGTARHLLPCRGAADEPAGPGGADFLDAGPSYDPAWTLIGCQRSSQIFEALYGTSTAMLDFCPRARPSTEPSPPRLTKCCLIERGVETSGSTAVVPWGANLDEVRTALRHLVSLGGHEGRP